jgi:hypothetical protein
MKAHVETVPDDSEPETPPPKLCPFCRTPLPLAFDCTLCGRWKDPLEESPAARSHSDTRKEIVK